MLSRENQEICELFARALDYPSPSLVESAADCAQRLAGSFPSIAEPMQSFVTFAASQTPEALEELYSQTFDMTPATTFYFGYQLFGDNPKRSAFMVTLEEAYQADGFSSGRELADHLGVLLRFLGIARDADFVTPLLQECILPTLEKMEAILKKDKNAYGLVISALKAFLQQVSRKLVKTGGVSNV